MSRDGEEGDVGVCPTCGTKIIPNGFDGVICSNPDCDWWFCW
jgi:hypothetical protein